MKRIIHLTTFIVAMMCGAVACSDEESAKGKVQLFITDAPVDDENVDGVFLSIKGVEMKSGSEWKTVAEFEEPVSLNILDYQEGNSLFLTDAMLEAGTYTEARLLLNAPEENAEPGNDPGCYLRYIDGSTQPLFVPSGAQSGYKVKGEFTLNAGGTVAVTIDFDVRKSIVEAGASERFILKPVVRLIANEEAAQIEGTYGELSLTNRVIVYAYEKGTYSSAEAEVSAETGIRFSKAITSTQIGVEGDFVLGFVAPGEYDLVFVAIDDNGDPADIFGYVEAELTGGELLQLIVTSEILIGF